MNSIDFHEAEKLRQRYPKVFRKREAEVNEQRLALYDYYYVDGKVFSSEPASRNMRGVVFDLDTKQIASLPFHKFYNVNENEETLEDNLTMEGRMFDKQDGSLLQMTFYNGGLILASRSSLTGYVATSTKAMMGSYGDLVEYVRRYPNVTFLFEYLDPNNPIVLRPNREELVFLNARDKHTGGYLWGEHAHKVPCRVTPSQRLEDGMWPRVKEGLYSSRDFEGFVLELSTGLYKVKTQWYVQAHKILTGMSPLHYIAHWSSGTLDDITASLRSLGYTDVVQEMQDTIGRLDSLVDKKIATMVQAAESCASAKELAILLNTSIVRDDIDKMLMGLVMAAYRSGNMDYGAIYNGFRQSLEGQASRQARIVDMLVHYS